MIINKFLITKDIVRKKHNHKKLKYIFKYKNGSVYLFMVSNVKSFEKLKLRLRKHFFFHFSKQYGSLN